MMQKTMEGVEKRPLGCLDWTERGTGGGRESFFPAVPWTAVRPSSLLQGLGTACRTEMGERRPPPEMEPSTALLPEGAVDMGASHTVLLALVRGFWSSVVRELLSRAVGARAGSLVVKA